LGVRWSEEEITFLRNSYKEMTDKEIAQKVRRSPESIQTKRGELRLIKCQQDICQPTHKLKLTETDKAYLAGLIDGDGSIFLSYFKYPAYRRGTKKRGIHAVISCAISARSANRIYAESILTIMGGRISRVEENYWEVSIERRADILQLAEALLPYLRLKKKEAEIMIEYCKDRLSQLKKRRNAPFTQKSFELVDKIKRLNNTPMNERSWQ